MKLRTATGFLKDRIETGFTSTAARAAAADTFLEANPTFGLSGLLHACLRDT